MVAHAQTGSPAIRHMTDTLFVAAVLLFPALSAISASSDLITMQIPNRISLALIAAFAVAVVLGGIDPATVGLHAAVALATLAVTFTLFAIGQIGGGDAKLAAAMALWMGPEWILAFLVTTSFFGGLLTLAFLGFRTLPLPAVAAREDWIQRLHAKDHGIPYGIALSVGGLLVFPETVWFETAARILAGATSSL